MNHRAEKIQRKEMVKNRLPSDVERRRDLELFESAILKDEFYDLGDLERANKEPAKEQK